MNGKWLVRWILAGGCSAAALALLVVLGSCDHVQLGSGAPEEGFDRRAPAPPGTTELWILESPAAHAPRLDESSPRGGELKARLAADRMAPLPLKHTAVKARIALSIASVNVKQEYHNPYTEKIEAVYVFPLPEDAAVRDFVMTIGDRHIRGIIREREEARRIYREARSQGYVASLLTEERPNIFAQSVADIEPGKAIDIDLTYFHALKYRDGEYEWAFPMVVGPRYNPAGSRDGVGAVAAGNSGASGQKTEVEYLRPNEISTRDISLEVDLDAGLAIESIASLTHQVDVERPGESKARLSLRAGDRIPNRDFVLRYSTHRQGVGAAIAVAQDSSDGYFMLVVEPPVGDFEAPAPPRELVFVLDCSGSMDGEPIARAKAVLKASLGRLRPIDTFQVIQFSQSASTFGPAPIPATPENVGRAIRYVEGLKSEGGTEMLEGVKAALDFPHQEGRRRMVAFLTDGYIGNEAVILREVRQRLGSSRIFSFGVGSSVNRHLLEELARIGRGAVAYLALGAPDRDAEEVVRFFERIERPGMTGLRIDWGELQAAEVFPDPLPDLFPGRPVVLTGRFSPRSGKVTIKVMGNVGAAARVIPLTIDLDGQGAEQKVLECVWARAKIAALASELATSSQEGTWAGQITQVALRHGLVSDFTSLVAVDSLARTAGDHGITVPVPVNMPRGVRYDTTVGER